MNFSSEAKKHLTSFRAQVGRIRLCCLTPLQPAASSLVIDDRLRLRSCRDRTRDRSRRLNLILKKTACYEGE